MKNELSVIFRKHKDGEVIAFFPAFKTNPGMLTSYTHIGQHSEASIDFYKSCKTAEYAEYSKLLEELKEIYDEYELVVRTYYKAVK